MRISLSQKIMPFQKGHKVNLGRACSEETKKKVSERHKRQTPWNKGKKGLQIHSEETRKKIKENHARYWLGKKGLPRSEEWKQKIGSAHRKSQLGRKHTEETRQKIFNHPNSQRGKSHWNWKGGITDYERRLYFNRRRRVKKLGNGGAHSQGEWETLKAQYNWTCPCCKRTEPEIKLTEDHIVPLSKGGSDNIENIQPLCKSCNCRKHDKIKKY